MEETLNLLSALVELIKSNKKYMNNLTEKLQVHYVPLASLHHPELNPRVWSKEATEQLKKSIKLYGVVDPLIVNNASSRKGIIVGGNFRATVLKEMGVETVPVVYVNIPDKDKEAELNIRLNRNTGEFDLNLLAQFDESLLADIGFTSEEIDNIFPADENPEMFDLEKELQKLNINKIEIQKGDVWQIGDVNLGCGDSTIETDILRLMDGAKADMVCTDPPYLLDYLRGKKKKGDAVTGFGAKRDRRYLETDVLPPDFTEKWMSSVAKVQKPDFSILILREPKESMHYLERVRKALEVPQYHHMACPQ